MWSPESCYTAKTPVVIHNLSLQQNIEIFKQKGSSRFDTSIGSFEYKNAFGALSVAEDAPQEPLGLDSVFLIASCTKLMTSISALQCVERGLVQLDEDVARHLPELAALEILTGFDDEGKAKTAKRQNAITLR